MGEILGKEKPSGSRPARGDGGGGLTPARAGMPLPVRSQELEVFQTKSGAIFWRQRENNKGKKERLFRQ